MRNDDDIALFQEEAAELIEALESGLLELERERSDDVINRVFRAIHTIKGGAGLVGLDELAYFSHEVEHLMQHVRAGDVEPAEDVIAVLLGATDLVRMFVAENIPEESARRPILRGLHDVLAHRGLKPAKPLELPGRSSPAPAPAGQPQYVVGAEDVIEVVYWREKELSAEATVRPDGRISLPLLGEVMAAGLTPSELADCIRALARNLLEAPEITVQVKQVNSLKATIAGEVVRPGRYAVTPQTTVVELIAMAGGFTEFARPSRIGIVRSVNGTQTAIKVDYRRIASLKDLRENVTLRPGDIIVVP